MNIAPGYYTFATAKRRVCQNGGSNGMGFIRVIGRGGSGGQEAYPGLPVAPPSMPGTREIRRRAPRQPCTGQASAAKQYLQRLIPCV